MFSSLFGEGGDQDDWDPLSGENADANFDQTIQDAAEAASSYVVSFLTPPATPTKRILNSGAAPFSPEVPPDSPVKASFARYATMVDYKNLARANLPLGLYVLPCSHDDLLWDGVLFPHDGSDWEGGCFKFRVSFGARYPEEMPEIRFTSRVYHPSVRLSDRQFDAGCFLPPGGWVPHTTRVSHLLRCLHSAFHQRAHQVEHASFNMDAAETCARDLALFRTLAQQNALESIQLAHAFDKQSADELQFSAYDEELQELRKALQNRRRK